jgi:hypothetical protein
MREPIQKPSRTEGDNAEQHHQPDRDLQLWFGEVHHQPHPEHSAGDPGGSIHANTRQLIRRHSPRNITADTKSASHNGRTGTHSGCSTAVTGATSRPRPRPTTDCTDAPIIRRLWRPRRHRSLLAIVVGVSSAGDPTDHTGRS